MGKTENDNLYRVVLRVDKGFYSQLLKLKIMEGNKDSFNKWMNKVLARVLNENKGLISGYTVHDEDDDF